MALSNNQQILTDDLFRLFRDYIHEKCGIFFKENNKYLLERRLESRMKELNFSTLNQYYYYLMYDPRSLQEQDSLFDAITTNETYFFREERQLKAFLHEIVPETLAQKKSIRIWSAGCSSGEEPYTIAILLHEAGFYDRAKIDIYGSDISQEALKKARKGIYREISFRNTQPQYRDRYFVPQENGTYRICDMIKEKVSFGRLNLMDTTRVSLLGYLDVIFCRNVIIYFDEVAKRKVIEMMHDRLTPSGYLLLGHSESLISITTKFKLKHLRYDLVYQK
ncbi:MAG TPA: protein-glutamate O-methyltransferase CheR [Thermoanaerobaculia bacterium]|nr:protein-glutamate O-methyltransferase CheR [Thermoanaerobaculia bacterium]HUM31153.1 protein-glutamate O-methyltransferase CheR [Thermoanaerobaculia bacterium]HXK69509.1 protein-glutamate O-methyltransferase CheR [Thermoanaerobaculia bacterium]